MGIKKSFALFHEILPGASYLCPRYLSCEVFEENYVWGLEGSGTFPICDIFCVEMIFLNVMGEVFG